ncbi:aldehyde dehydrogenase (NAD+) [Desulfotomaculum arcticum]|uniref:aldehyde dehydrogenase (NAD(+)) n=1 Tax=Desulfotruncus arcticus DSM 17038 TaxID=1121424 RepID=A0A1I2QQ94_9FIRM|nr:aldehyde dehydrogenase family protein [Desulfotruncus arcticus]SFG29833.1 aldehyde dehydrogenase (NAD+) [Desulfotomaculum arcticum] [Desulfotruncus arcticus DSM 17038]
MMNNNLTILHEFGIEDQHAGVYCGEWLQNQNAPLIESVSPVTGDTIASVYQATKEDYELVINKAQLAFNIWRNVPAPKRGEIVRLIGIELRKYKHLLGQLVTLEMGKLLAEGEGEVQEMIDIADFAVGLSRQLYGLTIASEREKHRLYEQWQPLGPVGIITAFNFPVAVWSWNALIAAIAGDVMIWKPSSVTPLTAIAVQKIVNKVVKEQGLPEGIFNLLISQGSTVGQEMLQDKRIPLISFTGSIPTGRRVAEQVAGRLGKTILELGGNNAIIITENANLDLAIRAVLFGAVGTSGQRCTTTRRLIIHDSIYDTFISKLTAAYKQVKIGNPFNQDTVMGPLVNKTAVDDMMAALENLKRQGGKVLYGGEILQGEEYQSGCYVTPCIAEAENHYDIVQKETFAPILYVMKYASLEEALNAHNNVPQGLSSAIFSSNMYEIEHFLGPEGSDCGIANVNIGTSGAEIGGAFGGEKETGGGRESGSDAWKAYMRRQTVTINWGSSLPLAQGITFGEF